MTRPRSSNAYADCKPILDTAIAAGGGRYELSSERDAVKWRQRAYSYRALLRREREAALGLRNLSTPYDGINLTVEGPVVVIKAMKPEGRLLSLEGEELDIPQEAPQPAPSPQPQPPAHREPSETELIVEAERLFREDQK